MVALEVVSPGGTVLTVTENGYGKRTDLEEYRVQSRGRQGPHQHQDHRPERPGGGGEVPARATRR